VVVVRTRNDAGRLSARMMLPLDDYAGQAVTVTLADGNSPAIASAALGSLAPLGVTGRRWQFRSTADGLQKVVLKSAALREHAGYKVQVKAKHWFTAADADEPAESTELTIQIGTACFRHVATKKVD